MHLNAQIVLNVFIVSILYTTETIEGNLQISKLILSFKFLLIQFHI